jgi:hypothetical protein
MILVPCAAQTAGSVLMVRPHSFGWNAETSDSNRFQCNPGAAPESVAAAAAAEFAALLERLQQAGVDVHVVDDRPVPRCPDAVFPNNWVSFHADGSVVVYPMLAPGRRLERRCHRLHEVVESGSFRVSRLLDLTHHELEGRFLEGTGSVVFDHAGRRAFASLSPRTDPNVLAELCDELGYRPVVFGARDRGGRPIYHTNVLLAIGRRYAVVCAEAIDATDRDRVLSELVAHGREAIAIDHAQLHAFAGNVLELATQTGDAVLAMSRCAHDAFTPAQRSRLAGHVDAIVTAAIPTIERVGGGSVRCMLAEIFLPRAGQSTVDAGPR